MPEKKINQQMELLVRKWQSGQLSEAERAELDQWYNSFDDSLLTEDSTESVDAFRQGLYLQILEGTSLTAASETTVAENITSIHEPARSRNRWSRLAAAASVLFILSGAAYLTIQNRHRSSPAIAK